MKPVARKILQMRSELVMRDRVDIKDSHSMMFRNLFQLLTVPRNLPLILAAHEVRNARRTRHVGNVCHHDPRSRFLFERAEDLFVIS